MGGAALCYQRCGADEIYQNPVQRYRPTFFNAGNAYSLHRPVVILRGYCVYVLVLKRNDDFPSFSNFVILCLCPRFEGKALNGVKIAMERQDCPCSFQPTFQCTFQILPLFPPKKLGSTFPCLKRTWSVKFYQNFALLESETKI